ncbi:hypothetical protein HWX16_16940 [Ochrobactrum intermedium]|uniref:hypothetical protein n=1 Tax=Brucella intermedia TaxID=94625 RepID=UPI00159BFC21|nr:hypothetical protein [Brucella intermedia]NVM42017.1 hypothetical protein [Brucella intermedia]
MELNEVWLVYANKHMLSNAADLPPIEFTASETLRCFFDVHPMFTGRWDAIMSVSFNAAFEEEADMGLVQLAATNSFKDWERLSAGAWRVINERMMYSEVVLSLTMAREPKSIMDRLPQGLGSDQQTIALLLKYLLGHGRTIDRRVLPVKDRRSLVEFGAMQTLRQQ